MLRTLGGLVVAAVLIGAVPVVGAGDRDDPEFAPLFDGRTLDGWAAESTDRFTVRDGLIANDGGTGWLRSEKRYKDFEFRAEFRVVRRGSASGLFFRAASESQKKAPHWPVKGYEIQVVDSDHFGMVFGHGVRPKFDRKGGDVRKVLKRRGDWQSLALEVRGAHAEVTLNGTLVAVCDAIDRPEGHIGLQGENGRFEWRALRIREFPSP